MGQERSVGVAIGAAQGGYPCASAGLGLGKAGGCVSVATRIRHGRGPSGHSNRKFGGPLRKTEFAPRWQLRAEEAGGLRRRATIIALHVENRRINASEAGTRMKPSESHVQWVVSAVVAGVLLAGCANSAASVGTREDLLSQAGFQFALHGTPAYATAVQQLAPYRFGHHTAGGVTTYYYRDPMICGCLYIGTAQNWAAYKVDLAAKMHMDAEKFLEQDDMATGNGS
jgi:hypothetical protein